MTYQIDSEKYNVSITKKNNKHTYIRVKDDLTIYVTTNYLVSKSSIESLLDENIDYLRKMINKRKKSNIRNNELYILGKKYNLHIDKSIKKIEVSSNDLYVSSEKYLDNWIKKETRKIFLKRLDYIYNLFEEKIPYPALRIRSMTTRWGVCNKRTKVITLNSKLIRESIEKLDYVIVHELSHFVHFDHSSSFWALVEKYCPNYKKIRKELKDGE